jgi:hypothetical protein
MYEYRCHQNNAEVQQIQERPAENKNRFFFNEGPRIQHKIWRVWGNEARVLTLGGFVPGGSAVTRNDVCIRVDYDAVTRNDVCIRVDYDDDDVHENFSTTLPNGTWVYKYAYLEITTMRYETYAGCGMLPEESTTVHRNYTHD